MKRIKVLIILLMVVLLSGCSVEYNLIINDDTSVNEKVVAKEITNRMKANTGLGKKESLNYLYYMFDRQNLKTKMTSSSENGYTIAKVTGSHNSLSAYAENFKSDIVPEVKYTEKDNIVTLEFDQTEVLSSKSSRTPIYDDITVNIKVPFKVISSNSSSSYRDTYTWKIKKDQKVKKIKISFDKSDLKYKKLITIGKSTYSIKYEYIALGIFLFVILLVILIVYVNNKKNNKI